MPGPASRRTSKAAGKREPGAKALPKRSREAALDKTVRMYTFAFYSFSECVLLAKGGMCEMRSGFDMPALQEVRRFALIDD